MEAILVVLLASSALLVRAGQMLGAMGIARAKNVASAGFRSLADLCVAVLCFWAVGAAITFQTGNQVFGIDAYQLLGWKGSLSFSSHWFSTLAIVLIATGIVTPALAERSRLRVPLVVGGVLAGVLVPIFLHWIRFGWLSNLGFIDAGGAAGIHLAPALCAATAAIFVGPREGKYNRDGSSNMIPGHSVPMILVSVILMTAGWVPYVVATRPLGITLAEPSKLPQLAANVLVCAAAAGLVSLVTGHVKFGKTDILLVCSGVLGGLVSISAGAARVGTPAAFLIGAIAGFLVPYLTVMIDLRWKIDDPGGVIAIHGVGAVWSLIAAGLFAEGAWWQHARQVGVQLLGMVVVTITSIALAMIVMMVLRAMGPLRSREADEYDGLDLAEHDINAHPDFQQTMIKSYHLREA